MCIRLFVRTQSIICSRLRTHHSRKSTYMLYAISICKHTHTHAHARTHQPVKTQQPPPAEPPNTAQKCKHHGNGVFVHCANARTEKHYRYGVCVHLPPHALFPFGSGGKSARIGITLSSSCVAVTVAVMYVCCVCVCVHSRK